MVPRKRGDVAGSRHTDRVKRYLPLVGVRANVVEPACESVEKATRRKGRRLDNRGEGDGGGDGKRTDKGRGKGKRKGGGGTYPTACETRRRRRGEKGATATGGATATTRGESATPTRAAPPPPGGRTVERVRAPETARSNAAVPSASVAGGDHLWPGDAAPNARVRACICARVSVCV